MNRRVLGTLGRLGKMVEGLDLAQGGGASDTQAPGESLQKVTTDTLLLADFILPLKNVNTMMELGVGTGALVLVAARKSRNLQVAGVEIHHGAAACAVGNIHSNSLADRVRIIHQDWRGLYDSFSEGSFDLVVSNPPYIKKGTGRVSPVEHRAVARHESAGTLTELVDVATYLAGEHGRVAFVYPIGRFCELLGELHSKGLVLRRLAFVYTHCVRAKAPSGRLIDKPLKGNKTASLFLIEFGRSGVFKVGEPVFI